MMWLEWRGQLIALFPSDMNYLDDTKPPIELQCSVDAGSVDRRELSMNLR